MTDHTTQELIELGRDREAVAAATQGPLRTGAEQLDEILPMLEALVARITDDQLDLPTPCPGFTVAGVLEHMIGGVIAFAPALRGDEPAAPPIGSPQERFRLALAELAGAVHTPGAQTRTISAPFGEVPGAVLARYVAFDGLVHGWDLATATGQTYTPADALVIEVDDFARSLLTPEMRDGDTFAAAVDAPADASLLQRLVAFSGRNI